ncbi:multicopper oxidase domain-containing protein [Methylomicrobium lacus]|uniref:multicopper oxidase domain-containing protein n=1 Tax=Methylomicrobium lacus TaxID=136992 RepID=UPI0035A91272
MNKKIKLSVRDDPEKRGRDRTGKAQIPELKLPDSMTRSVLATTISKADSSLAWVIAALSVSLIHAAPVKAAFNIPTDSTASPLCINGQCATPFSAKLLLFEEFGLQKMPGGSSQTSVLPSAPDCQSSPAGQDLDAFLKEEIHPYPGAAADETLTNAWEAKVKGCVGLSDQTPTRGDARPGGEWFSHQRWDEFFPQTYFQSAMSGARANGGLRDGYQMHKYNKGEFGPNGLYYLPNGTAAGIEVKIHPNLPAQNANSVWTFDGTLPPKLLMARYGESILFRHYNALPIDESANKGFGRHTITTHEHNGHNPAESDGFMHAYAYPGEFYDYHWPMILAGHDSINTGATDYRAGSPDGNGGIIPVRGDWRETMSTHWFHDHMLDFTAQNVYKGNAAMMNYYSAVDRGKEPKDILEASGDHSKPGYGCHYAAPDPANPGPFNVNLCLPSGSELDWGNRDYDVNLLVADKAWDDTGQLKYNIFNTDGYLGDRITVNWVYKPYLDVRARRYRFRILNGSVSRYYKIAIVDETGKKIPYYMIANDGNLLQHAVPFPNSASAEGALPEQGIAERYDIVVDFNGMAGKKLYFVNLLEHVNGLGPSKVVALADVLSGKYKADGINGDPVVGKFLELRVKDYSGTDLSMDPYYYQETFIDPVTKKVVPGKQMIPLNKPTTQELQAAVQRTFEFGKSDGTDLKPWTIKTDGGKGFNADEHRVSAAPTLPDQPNGLGKVEIWHIKLGGGGWSHPVHVHFEEGQILYRGGKAPPPWEKYARKDVYRIGSLADSTASVDMAIRFREFAGTYVEHCHNTQHEDRAMLLRWDIEHPGQTLAIPTPMPGWEGVQYDPSIYLPTAKTGDLVAKKSFVLPQ